MSIMARGTTNPRAPNRITAKIQAFWCIIAYFGQNSNFLVEFQHFSELHDQAAHFDILSIFGNFSMARANIVPARQNENLI